MLNPDLKLNPKLFDEDVEQKPTRNGYGKALLKLAEKNPNVIVITADLSESTRVEEFAKKYPNRFIDCGVAEQNMAALAAGLALSNKIPFISSYATFSPGKNWETIRTTIIYNNANVKFAGHHSGIMTGPDGATHQATEDIASVRAWPGLHIFVPCDVLEAEKATVFAEKINGPVYLRFSRDNSPILTTSDTPFGEGKIQKFWSTPNPVATIFGMGYMLYYCLLAARDLEKENINVEVANVSCIKPLDTQSIIELAQKTKAFVTVEDHQVAGGLGGTIAETLVKNFPIPMEFIGLQDTFAESGNPKDLIEKYKMGTSSIIEAVKKVISRK